MLADFMSCYPNQWILNGFSRYQKLLFRKPLFVQLCAVFGAVGVVKMPAKFWRDEIDESIWKPFHVTNTLLKLNMEPENDGRNLLFQGVMFRFHDKLWGVDLFNQVVSTTSLAGQWFLPLTVSPHVVDYWTSKAFWLKHDQHPAN